MACELRRRVVDEDRRRACVLRRRSVLAATKAARFIAGQAASGNRRRGGAFRWRRARNNGYRARPRCEWLGDIRRPEPPHANHQLGRRQLDLDAEVERCSQPKVDVVPQHRRVDQAVSCTVRRLLHAGGVGVAFEQRDARACRAGGERIRQLAKPTGNRRNNTSGPDLTARHETPPSRRTTELAPEAEHAAGGCDRAVKRGSSQPQVVDLARHQGELFVAAVVPEERSMFGEQRCIHKPARGQVAFDALAERISAASQQRVAPDSNPVPRGGTPCRDCPLRLATVCWTIHLQVRLVGRS